MRIGKLIKTKGIAGAVSTILAVSLILGGTLAYRDYSQHAANEFSGTDAKYAVHLIEDFKEVNDWKVTDPSVKKEIRVRNMGGTEGVAGVYQDVYVRLQLKEYMEIAKLNYTYSDSRLMINTDGAFYAYNTKAEAEAAFPGHQVEQHKALGTDADKWYIVTQAHDDNGQYGRFLILGSSQEGAKSLVDGVQRAVTAATNEHHDDKNGECDYTIHKWDGVPTVFEEYIEWFKGADVITMDAWDGTPVAKWILDTNSPEGWVYWGEALKPGIATSNLLEKVSLKKQPNGSFYYTIHTDMQAVSYDELGTWTDMPKKVSDAYNAPSAPQQKTITAIAVNASPDKTDYTAGESFDPVGMTVTVTYDDGTSETLPATDSRISWSPSGGLTENDKKVTVSVKGSSANIEIPITVGPAASQPLPDDVKLVSGVDGRTVGDIIKSDDYNWRIISKDQNGNLLLHAEETFGTTIFGSDTDTSLFTLINGGSCQLVQLNQYAQPTVTVSETLTDFSKATDFASIKDSSKLSYVDSSGTKKAFYLNLSELNAFDVTMQANNWNHGIMYKRSYKVNTTGTDIGAKEFFLLYDQRENIYQPIAYANGMNPDFVTPNRPAVWVNY